jgi:hypothetical protein
MSDIKTRDLRSEAAVARQKPNRQEDELRDLIHKILTDRVVFRGGAAQEQLAHFMAKVPSLLLSMPFCIATRAASDEGEVSGKRGESCRHTYSLRSVVLMFGC